MEMTVKIEGLKELERNLQKLNEQYGVKSAGSAMRPAIRAALKPAEATIKATTPVDSGALAESTKIRISKPTKKMIGSSGHYNSNQVLAGRVGWTWRKPSLWNRALAVEFGTRSAAAQPTLNPAFDKHKDQMIETFKSELAKSITKTAKRLSKKNNKRG